MWECTPPSLSRPSRWSWRARPRSMASTEERLALEFATGDELVNAGDVHVHDAAGADIQMADFAIAHLSFGEADSGAGGVDERVGKFAQEAIVIWFARKGDRIAGGFGAIAPAVEDGEDDGFWAFGL